MLDNTTTVPIVTKNKMLELLERAKAAKNAQTSGLDNLRKQLVEKQVEQVDFGGTGVGDLKTSESEEAAVDFLVEITSTSTSTSTSNNSEQGTTENVTEKRITNASEAEAENSRELDSLPGELDRVYKENTEFRSILPRKPQTGVAKEIELNNQQQQFHTTALRGEDCCLIGAAGTGKTTCTGKFIRELVSSGKVGCVGEGTKYINSTLPGILICSYTRKAVNNIRRAVPSNLRDHTLTLHKVLEYAPVFYEIEDPQGKKNGKDFKLTMRFEPKRNKYNPLPGGLKVVIFEESSMIGTDLYNNFKEATPHLPQEIFIGDIQQLPPIFGPAILGFKMALLPIIELTEVYRQALNSPIIRLAHAILSGDPYKFDKSIKIKDELHPELGKMLKRKYCPSLEAFSEKSEFGSVKFQIWQKNQDAEISCNATIQQFIAWEKTGYYRPEKDIILCPFNKTAFGTIELNKGLLSYFGRRRNAVVHEIIAGFNKHYYAIGDRVLYDKEDAKIVDIKRNVSYLGKTPKTPSVDLSRDGGYIRDLTEEELNRSAEEEALLLSTGIEDYLLDQFANVGTEEEEGRVQISSHAVTLKFTYSEEILELRSAAEINNLLGGHAITVHKFQGSEEENVFLVMHKSHAVSNQRELLYTAVTRASKQLHIICENDTFFNGVKSQKVKGTTLQEKIEYFKGKGKFLEMKEEMEMLRLQAKVKRELLEKSREKELKLKQLGAPKEYYLSHFFNKQQESCAEMKEDWYINWCESLGLDPTIKFAWEIEKEKKKEEKETTTGLLASLKAKLAAKKLSPTKS